MNVVKSERKNRSIDSRIRETRGETDPVFLHDLFPGNRTHAIVLRKIIIPKIHQPKRYGNNTDSANIFKIIIIYYNILYMTR